LILDLIEDVLCFTKGCKSLVVVGVVVRGPGQNFLTQVGSVQFFVARVWLGKVWFESGFGNFLLKSHFFNFSFEPGEKGKSTSYLQHIKSMLGSGQGRSLSGCWDANSKSGWKLV